MTAVRSADKLIFNGLLHINHSLLIFAISSSSLQDEDEQARAIEAGAIYAGGIDIIRKVQMFILIFYK